MERAPIDSLPEIAVPPSPLPWWRRLERHPIFPLLILLLLTQAIRDEFPFSHYPMYSMPPSRPLKYQFLADEHNMPLAHVYHTGISPSQVGKRHGNQKKVSANEHEAAMKVLLFLRGENAKRPKRPLPEKIRLIETKLGFGNDTFTETNTVLAEHTLKRKKKD